MQSYRPTRLIYLHADAHAIGGHQKTPVEKFVPTLAPVSLPAVGGYTAARSPDEGFRFDDIVSCSKAYTRVESANHGIDGSATLLVTSVVENLDILEVFRADRITAQLTITVPESGDITVSTIGSAYEGIRIAGVACHPKVTKGLQPLERTPEGRTRSLHWSDVRAIGRTQAQALLSSFKARNESDVYQWAEKKYGWLTTEPAQGTASSLCSLVDGVETTASAHCHGHVIEIPHFGRITLGELIVNRGYVRLTGVRADLGCVVGGGITVCAEGGGGIGDD